MKDSPAFPIPTQEMKLEEGGTVYQKGYPGLTIRQYAAIQIAAGLVANHSLVHPDSIDSDNWPDTVNWISQAAEHIADALVEELERTK